MADVVFTPKFVTPTPYVDGRDRVRAAGANGFNDRFAAIADDFAALHDIVGDINTALLALGQQPAPTQQRITLSPALIPITGSQPWTHDSSGFASRPATLANIAGIMPVSLPLGAQLQTLRVVGQANSNNANLRVRVALLRSRLLGTPQPPDRLVRVDVTSDPFDGGLNIDPQFATVDANFRYFINATVDSAVNADVVTLSAFQIIYLAG